MEYFFTGLLLGTYFGFAIKSQKDDKKKVKKKRILTPAPRLNFEEEEYL
jgi:hypothetical protein